jgi:hypothetical protein
MTEWTDSQDGHDKIWKFRTAGVCSVERAFWGKLQIQLAIFPKMKVVHISSMSHFGIKNPSPSRRKLEYIV